MWFPIYSLIRILGCVTFIFHWRKKTYKLFTPLGNKSRKAELMANRTARKADFWSGTVLKVRPHLLSLSMKTGLPVSEAKYEKAREFVERKLEEALQCPRIQASEAYDMARLSALIPHGLDQSLVCEAEKQLGYLLLPQTGSHGDMHIDNMIFWHKKHTMPGKIKMIDWTMYHPKGSYIMDYMHFYNQLEAVRHGESWTVAILREQGILNQLAQELNTTPELLKLAYSVSRITGEMSQYRSLVQIPPSQIAKYNKVLSNLVTATQEA